MAGAIVLPAMLTACRNHPAPADGDVRPPAESPSDSSRTNAATAQSAAASAGAAEGIGPSAAERVTQRERYAAGRFETTGPVCRFFAPGDSAGVPFQCGGLIIGLARGVTSADAADLLSAISGEIRSDQSRTAGFVSVRVPVGTERAAILRAYDDPRVRYAELNVLGPAVLGAPTRDSVRSGPTSLRYP